MNGEKNNRWNVYDEFSEGVYIIDTSDDSVVYMNRYLRDLLGFGSESEYINKKCYTVLQGKDKKCDFCISESLKNSDFNIRICKNSCIDKRLRYRETVVIKDGKKFQLGFVVDIDDRNKEDIIFHDEKHTLSFLNGFFTKAAQNASIDQLLEYLGQNLLCDRAYIYELNKKDSVDNTYEWCAVGVKPQKEIIQNESSDVIAWWLNRVDENNVFILEDVEKIKRDYPVTYGFLKPQSIQSIAVTPIYRKGDIIGFLGLDNPSKNAFETIRSSLSAAAHHISVLMGEKELERQVRYLKRKDALTGAYNINVLYEKGSILPYEKYVGIICCDIIGIGKTNLLGGYKAGDNLILKCENVIKRTLEKEKIYCLSGSVFMSTVIDKPENEVVALVEKLKLAMLDEDLNVAVSYVWTDGKNVPTEKLIYQAQEKLETEKKSEHVHIYQNNYAQSGTLLSRYIDNYHCDFDSIVESITMTDEAQCIYFGDMQKNCFYISDNMKEKYGFDSNLVFDLLTLWEERIASAEYLKLYRDDIADMLKEKRTIHDLRYQVKDVQGNAHWIRCRGILHWDEKKEKPVFFSGSVAIQDNTFIIDPTTNFPGENAAIKALNSLERQKNIIIFALNSFSEINEIKGRYDTNVILKNICTHLYESFGSELDFYRLDGLKFLAIPKYGLDENWQDYIEKLKLAIEEEYQNNNITVRNSCSFGVLKYPNDVDNGHSFIENAIILVKAAKQNLDRMYLAYSGEDVKKHKETASLSMTINQNALDDMSNFRIVIQPVVDARSSRVVGGEVLMRWKNQGKDVSPAIFIPLMEKGKTICIAGKWIFEQTVKACRSLVTFNDDFYLTFNVSYYQIMDDDFVEFMERTIEKYNVSGKNLVAELTETHYDEAPKKLSHFVSRCAKMGIRVALDDFGSGYSSLGLLLKYPSNIVKLDRSLLLEMTESEDKTNFISSIVYACHRFGKKVCMEGVETENQNQLIKDAGCDYIQGYYHYKPMEVSQVYQILSAND